MGEPRASWNVIPLLSQEQMSFYVGQRLVVVGVPKDHPLAARLEYTSYGPKAGQVVTALAVYEIFGIPVVRLVEYPLEKTGWHALCFRPVDSLTEDMERIEAEGCPLEPEHA